MILLLTTFYQVQNIILSHLARRFQIFNFKYYMNKTLAQSKSSQTLNIKKYLEYAKLKSHEKDCNKQEAKSISPLDYNKYVQKQDKDVPTMLRKLEGRYKQLEERYKDLLEKAKQRNQQHQKVKTQLAKYKNYNDRDTKDIERLRCILGFIKKSNASTQVDDDLRYDSNGFRASHINKFDQSTEDQIKLKNSGQKFYPREKPSPGRSSSKKSGDNRFDRMYSKNEEITMSRVLPTALNQISPVYKHSRYEKELADKKSLVRKLNNSPYQKYRYVPKINLK